MSSSSSTPPAALPRGFSNLAFANLAGQSAEQLSLAAVPIVAVLALGAGPGEIGLLGVMQTLPFLIASIPFGLVADRSSRRGVMVLAESLRGLTLLGLLAATVSGQLSLTLLAVLGFMGAVGTVGFMVAAPALVPALVAREQFAQANGRLELARSAAFAAGPALAGALVAWAGGTAAFALAAMLSAGAVGLLLRLVEPPRAPAAQRHPWAELKDGARMVWRHQHLRPILLTACAWNISWFVLQAAYVPYAVRALGLSASGVGFTLAAFGAGMVGGALAAPRIARALPFGRAIQLGPVMSVAAALAMVATLVVPVGAGAGVAAGVVAGVSFFLFGFGPIVWTITSTTLRQTVTPGPMLGRVSSIFLTANAGARPLGAALGGMVGATWGEPACLVLAAVGFGLQAWVISASGLVRLRAMPQLDGVA